MEIVESPPKHSYQNSGHNCATHLEKKAMLKLSKSKNWRMTSDKGSTLTIYHSCPIQMHIHVIQEILGNRTELTLEIGRSSD